MYIYILYYYNIIKCNIIKIQNDNETNISGIKEFRT